MSKGARKGQSRSNGAAVLDPGKGELAAEHLDLLREAGLSSANPTVTLAEFSPGELDEDSFWRAAGVFPNPRFVRPVQETPDAVVAAGEDGVVVMLRRDLAEADRGFLIKHAVMHVALGHIRPGDNIAHWDVLSRLRDGRPLCRWDTQVAEHLTPRKAHTHETFSTGGLSEIWSRLNLFELDPPLTSAALLLKSYRHEVVEVPRALTESAQLFPHQTRGIAEIVARLRRFNTTVLADSVGLGKTRTTCAVIRMLRDAGSQRVSAILTPRKLERNWRKEMSVVGLEEGHDVVLLNKDVFKRLSVQEAARQLRGVGLVVVEEAHQDLRNPGSRFHRNLRDSVGLAQGLLVTATPWNNRRGDIFSILSPFVRPLPGAGEGAFECFKKGFRTGRKEFEESDEVFHQIYGSVVLQRTRRQLREMGDAGVFYAPRAPKLDVVDYRPSQQTAFQTLFGVVEALHLPYFNPVRYLTAESDAEWRLSGTYRFFLLKRAESSMAALRLTLRSMKARAEVLREQLAGIKDSGDAVARWLGGCYNISEDVIEDALESSREGVLLGERVTRPRQRRALRLIDEAGAKGRLRPLRRRLIADCEADIKLLDKVEKKFAPLFDSDPKLAAVISAARESVAAGNKVLLVSQFADTAFTVYKAVMADPALGATGVGLVMSTAKGGEHPIQADGRKATREEVIRRFAPRAWSQSVVERGRENGAGLMPGERELTLLVGTDTLSVGQNLQDARTIIHLDLTWNPMVLEQRIGRLDRPRHETDDSPIEIRYFLNLDLIEAELELKKRIDARLAATYQDTSFDDEILPGYFELIETMRRLRASRASENAIAEEVDAMLEELAAARPPDVGDLNVESRRRALERLGDAVSGQELPEPTPPLVVTVGQVDNGAAEIAAELMFESFDNNGVEIGRPLSHLLVVSIASGDINAALDDLPRTVDIMLRPPFEGTAINEGVLEHLRAFDQEVERVAGELRDERNRLREKRKKIRERIRPAWLSPLIGRVRSFLENLPEAQYEQFLSRYEVSDEMMGAWLDALASGVNTDDPEMVERLRRLENSPASIVEEFGALRELIAEETFTEEESPPLLSPPAQLTFDNEPYVHKVATRITNLRINLPMHST
ncbi:MAG TPA: helicase-related protein [Pyrinomonadaceae bacterium]|nr:helicase-related protein [Pyrinomonadaceae bacterium]